MSSTRPRILHAQRSPRGRAAGQRGAIGLLGALTLMMAVLFAVLALDTGRLWMEQQNVQKTANMAAMESARYTSCGSTLKDATAAAQHAATANASPLSSNPMSVTVVRGTVATVGNKYVFTSAVEPTDNTNGTRVTVSRTVPASLMAGGLFSQNVTLKAIATARGGPPVTSFALGSTFFTVDTTNANVLNSLFGALLGSPLNISADGYNSILNLNLNIAGLMQATGLTTLDSLLNTKLPIGTLVTAITNAAGLTSTTTADGKNAIQKLIDAASKASGSLSLGDLLQIQGSVNNDGLLNANINMLNLLSLSFRLASPTAKYSFAVGVPGVASVDMAIDKASKLAIGPAGKSAVTGNYCTETRVDNTELGVNVAPTFLNNFFGGALVSIDFRVALVIAPAIAHAEYLEINPDQATAHMGVNTGLATVRITNTGDTGPATVKVLGLKVLEIGTKNDSTFFTYTQVPINIKTPVKDHLPVTNASSSESSGALQNLLAIGNLDLKVIGLDLSWATSLLKPISDMLSAILSTTLDPIIRVFGLNFGSANMQVQGLVLTKPVLVE